MKTIRIFTLLSVYLFNSAHSETIHEFSPQHTFISQQAQAWSDTYLDRLSPYTLQLAASNLHLLYNQALYTAYREKLKQRIMWAACEAHLLNNPEPTKNTADDGAQLAQLIATLETIAKALETCTQLMQELDNPEDIALLNEALEAIMTIGQTALSFHKDTLSTQIPTIQEQLTANLYAFTQYDPYIRAIQDIQQDDFTALAQFYALQKITAEIASDAWQIINLDMANNREHIDHVVTCAVVFKTCLQHAYEKLMNPEVPEQYRSLLFDQKEAA